MDVKADAALACLDRHKAESFPLYLAYMTPRTPLDAPRKYLDRFPGEPPARSRYTLANALRH
jgi:uncharacterized sulfatase